MVQSDMWFGVLSCVVVLCGLAWPVWSKVMCGLAFLAVWLCCLACVACVVQSDAWFGILGCVVVLFGLRCQVKDMFVYVTTQA